MMKRLIRTSFTRWDMNPAMIETLKESLQKVGTIDTVTYRSKFHILFPDYNKIIHSEPSPIGESNQVDYLLNGVVILQFFRVFGVAGRLLDSLSSSSFTSFDKVLVVLFVGVAIIGIYQYRKYF